MNLLVIADPLDHFKIYKDTTFAMLREAARRGHAAPGRLLRDRVHALQQCGRLRERGQGEAGGEGKGQRAAMGKSRHVTAG